MSHEKVYSPVGTSFATVAQKLMHELPHIWFEFTSMFSIQFRLTVSELAIPIDQSSILSDSFRLIALKNHK